MLGFLKVLLLATLWLATTSAVWAGGYGPADWTGNADIIVVGTFAGGGKSAVGQKYFIQVQEVWKGTLTPAQLALLEVLATDLPNANAVKLVAFLQLGYDKKTIVEVGHVDLPAQGVVAATEALKEWTTVAQKDGHKILPEYKQLILKNLQSGHPVLTLLASSESIYLDHQFNADDGKTVEKVLYASKDPVVRIRLCQRLIQIHDPVFLPTWITVLGEAEAANAIIGYLGRFRPKENDPDQMHDRLDKAINEQLLKFEKLYLGAAEEAAAVQGGLEGLRHENYLAAVGDLKLPTATARLAKVFTMDKARPEAREFAMLSMGKLRLPETLEKFTQYKNDADIRLQGGAWLARAHYGLAPIPELDNTAPEALESSKQARDDAQQERTQSCQVLAGAWLDEGSSLALRQVVLIGLQLYKDSEYSSWLLQFFTPATPPEAMRMALETYSGAVKDELGARLGELLLATWDTDTMEALLIFCGNRRITKALPNLWTIAKDAQRPLRIRELATGAIRDVGGIKGMKDLLPLMRELNKLRDAENGKK